MFCPKCGIENVEGAKFCTVCGAAFEIETQPVEVAPAQPVAPVAPVQPTAPVQQYAPVAQPQYAQPQYAQPQYAQPQYAQPQYAQPQYNAYAAVPLKHLKSDWNMVILLLLSLVTCGIYSYYFYYQISEDINTIASKYDGKKIMNGLIAILILSPLTCGIYSFVWMHQISEKIGNELMRRGINYDFGAKDFWLWNVLGSFIIVGPFIYLHKLCEAMNLLAADYNTRG